MLRLYGKPEGQGLVEYGLIIFFVAIVIVLIVAVLGSQVGNMFSQVTNQIP